jgi:hypothetical protein
MQKMLAAELRQEAGRIAHDNALVKRRTTITGGINSLITGALTAHYKESVMSDSKKSTNKVRKPFLVAAQARTNIRDSRHSARATNQRNPWFLAQADAAQGAAVVLAVLTILPMRAHGQFGIDLAAILAALQKMQSLMSTYICRAAQDHQPVRAERGEV